MRWFEHLVFLALVVGLARPVGLYLAGVFEGRKTALDPVLRPLETLLHRLMRIGRAREMSAGVYTLSRTPGDGSSTQSRADLQAQKAPRCAGDEFPMVAI